MGSIKINLQLKGLSKARSFFSPLVRRKELLRCRCKKGASLPQCKSLPDHDGATVTHEAEVTHDYLFIRYFCSVLGDK